MKRVTLIGVLVLSCMLIATGALAASHSSSGGHHNSAGCGLGSLVLEGDSKGQQILTSLLNSISYNQAFGITSGTSNCTAEGLVKESKAQQAFAEVNFESLSQEMAQGQGEHLTAFAHLMGCSQTSMPDFGRVVQKNYTQIFPSNTTTPLEMLGAVKQSISADPVLAQACQA